MSPLVGLRQAPGVVPLLYTFYSMKLQGQDLAWRGNALQSTDRSLSKHSHSLFAGASIRRWCGESCKLTVSWVDLANVYNQTTKTSLVPHLDIAIFLVARSLIIWY